MAVEIKVMVVVKIMVAIIKEENKTIFKGEDFKSEIKEIFKEEIFKEEIIREELNRDLNKGIEFNKENL